MPSPMHSNGNESRVRRAWRSLSSQIVSPSPHVDEEKQEAQQLSSRDYAKRRASLYYSKGKNLANEGKWLSAIASYNKALMIQRESLGRNHPDAGRTLNDIGVAFGKLGRHRDFAITALEEALYIRTKAFGLGSEEVEETDYNLSLIRMEAWMEDNSEVVERTVVCERDQTEQDERRSLSSLRAAGTSARRLLDWGRSKSKRLITTSH